MINVIVMDLTIEFEYDGIRLSVNWNLVMWKNHGKWINEIKIYLKLVTYKMDEKKEDKKEVFELGELPEM